MAPIGPGLSSSFELGGLLDGGLGNCDERFGVEILGGGTLHMRLGDILLLGFLRPTPLFSDFMTSG